ncbi:MAG: sulfur carrier protein ThiS [Planctomycetia bacterium]
MPFNSSEQAPGSPCVLAVNGQRQDVPIGSTALDVVRGLGLEGRPMAVEVNGRVVPRADLGRCMLSSGDRLEVVTLVGGG